MASDAVAIARACYDAYVKKDRAAIEAVIADDFHFGWSLPHKAAPGGFTDSA